jgi:hypothetical protein
MYYINLGGFKILFGVTGGISFSATGNAYGITFPTSFFSTYAYGVANVNQVSTTWEQTVYLSQCSTTSASIEGFAANTTTAETCTFIIFGN